MTSPDNSRRHSAADSHSGSTRGFGQPELDSATTPGIVALTVRNLERSIEFYTHTMALDILYSNDTWIQLGSHGRPLLHLTEQREAQPWPGRGYAGLYHYALLYPSRLGLAQALNRLVEANYTLEGASDHGVSEAIYLRDPDGHGIEIYRDRPRAEWPFSNGTLQMVSDPLDLRDILNELTRQSPDWQGTEPGTSMGHIHLHTSDLDRALAFYRDALGLDLMQRYGGSALFLSAGGYHHHLGMNLWAGRDVPPPPSALARLLWYELVVPTDLHNAIARLEQAGYPATELERGWEIRDPAGLALRLVPSLEQ